MNGSASTFICCFYGRVVWTFSRRGYLYGVDSLGQVRQWGSEKNKPQNHSFTFRRLKVELEQSAWTEKHTLLENPEKNAFMSKCFWVSCDTSCLPLPLPLPPLVWFRSVLYWTTPHEDWSVFFLTLCLSYLINAKLRPLHGAKSNLCNRLKSDFKLYLLVFHPSVHRDLVYSQDTRLNGTNVSSQFLLPRHLIRLQSTVIR